MCRSSKHRVCEGQQDWKGGHSAHKSGVPQAVQTQIIFESSERVSVCTNRCEVRQAELMRVRKFTALLVRGIVQCWQKRESACQQSLEVVDKGKKPPAVHLPRHVRLMLATGYRAH